MHLTIALPGLFWQDIGDLDYLYNNAQLDKFNRLLKHAKMNILNYSHSDLVYSSIYKTGTVANNLAQSLGVSTEYRAFLVAEPTHLRLDRDRLLISEAELLQLDTDEAKSIINTINLHFTPEIKIYFVSEHLWLIGHNIAVKNEHLYSILDITGENIDDYMPNIQINKILNEIQMLLHSLAENKLRKEEGSLAVNSIWVWDKQVKSDIKYAQTYASGINGIQAIPTLIESAFTDKNLIIIDNLYYPCYYRDSFGWVDKINELNNALVDSLQRWLAAKNTLDILIPGRENTIQLCLRHGFLSGGYKFWENKQLITLVKEFHAL